MPIRRVVMTAAENEAKVVAGNGEAPPPAATGSVDTVDGPEAAAAQPSKAGDEAGKVDNKDEKMDTEESANVGDGLDKTQEKKDGSSDKEEKKEEEEVDVDSLMAQGKRDFYCGEYLKSVTALQRVCESLATKHGEMADEIAEPYLLYGKALLEVARIESDVLGNALDGIPEEQEAATNAEGDNDVIEKDSLTEEEKEKISEQVIDAMTEEAESAKEGEKEEAKEEKKEEEEGKEEKKEEECKEGKKEKEEGKEEKKDAEETKEGKETEEKKKEEEKEGTEEKSVEEKEKEKKEEESEKKEEQQEKEEEKEAEEEDAEMQDADDKQEEEEVGEEEEGEEGAEEEEDEEEVGNLQIAWEVVEVACKIFSRQENWVRVAECHVCLAEIGMEKEDWTQAEDDLSAAIRAYTEQAKVAKGDRRLATAYFQLAVASLADKKYAESKRAFDDSISHLQTHASQLNDKLKGGDSSEALTEAKRSELEKEIKDLDELIDELKNRIVEVDEERIDFEMMRKQLRAGVSSISGAISAAVSESAGASTDATPDASVNDISGLVRKKRKVEEPSEAIAPSPSKKIKTDSGANGTDIHPDADMPLPVANAAEEAPKVKTVEDVKMASEQQATTEQA